MKALVFVWTMKDIVAVVFIGIVLLYVAFIFIRYYIAIIIENWKAKRNKREEDEQ
jgi:hypothetical protein